MGRVPVPVGSGASALEAGSMCDAGEPVDVFGETGAIQTVGWMKHSG